MNQNWEEFFSLQTPEHEDVKKDNFECIVVDGKGTDLIFQMFSLKVDEVEELVAEVIEDHFGDTENFAIEFVPEMGMYGLLYKNAKDNPLFSKDFHVYEFLDILDKTITELQK